MAAERQSEAPFGGKACPESPAPAGHSGRALRLHGSGAVGASPRPCCATPGALPPPGARRPRPGACGSRRLPPRGLSPAPGARLAPPGVPLPPPPLRLYGRKAGAGLVALRWGAGAARSGALCGAGAAPPPRLLPRAPRLRSPACLRCSGALCHLAPYRGETTSVSPAPCRARRPVGRHDVNRRKGLIAPLAAGQ